MARTDFRRDEIILLLGAGASVDAGIPDSNNMVQKIHNLVSGDDKWKRFKDLYYYLRSSIYFAEGLEGRFGDEVHFNIESLVNVLDELDKRERHTLYPFVGAWSPKLLDVAGNNFDNVRDFRSNIIDVLRSQWVQLTRKENASYYTGLLRFQEEYGHPIRVFSLNYDLCVEAICEFDLVERGFSKREWEWRQFDETSEDSKPLMLYKLHGSLDWFFDDDGKVKFVDSPSTIDPSKIALIFGTPYKLQYIDPFLFCVYELRKWTLDSARVIVCVGYGFNDEHINGILEQSLRQVDARKLLAVIGPVNEQECIDEKRRICQQLKVDACSDKISTRACGAKEFFEEELTIGRLAELFPQEEDLFSSISDDLDN